MMRMVFRILFSALLTFSGSLPPLAAQETVRVSAEAVPSGPIGVFPPPDASRVHARPAVVWSEVSGAAGYIVECAEDF